MDNILSYSKAALLYGKSFAAKCFIMINLAVIFDCIIRLYYADDKIIKTDDRIIKSEGILWLRWFFPRQGREAV